MPSAKHNSALDKAMGWISLVFDIVLAWQVHFCPLQHASFFHHGLKIFVLYFIGVAVAA